MAQRVWLHAVQAAPRRCERSFAQRRSCICFFSEDCVAPSVAQELQMSSQPLDEQRNSFGKRRRQPSKPSKPSASASKRRCAGTSCACFPRKWQTRAEASGQTLWTRARITRMGGVGGIAVRRLWTTGDHWGHREPQESASPTSATQLHQLSEMVTDAAPFCRGRCEFRNAAGRCWQETWQEAKWQSL